MQGKFEHAPEAIAPLISVILVTYNHADFIEQAILSVLEQKTEYPFELLIGDDASTDGTSEIVERYHGAYPKLIRPFIRETNLGASKNAYLLLQEARGKYIASLEGDDYWTDLHKLQRQTKFLLENPEFIGCTHPCRCIDAAGNICKKRPNWIRQKKVFSLKDFQGVYLPGQASTLLRKNIFLRPQHDYSILTSADPMISDRTSALIFLLQGDIACLPRTMSVYRYRITDKDQNLTSQFRQSDQHLLRDYAITCRLEEYAQKEFGVQLCFSKFKTELYAKAFCHSFLEHSKTYMMTAKKIRNDHNSGWKCLTYLPWNLMKLASRRIRNLF